MNNQKELFSNMKDSRRERIANIILGILCLIPASIIMLIIYIVYLFACRKTGPFLYSGPRIGKNRKIFTMYKIRTLVYDAEKKIGARLYANDSSQEIWYGRFLRNTRLDELPQLFNVIKGDMDFVGPRPTRPLMYETYLKEFKGFEKRFIVRPGLTGYSQYYTPHGAPERMRILIDNLFIKKNSSFLKKLLFVIRTAIQLLLQIGNESSYLVTKITARHKSKPYNEDRRRFRRRRLKNAHCEIIENDEVNKKTMIAHPIDINNESILLRCQKNGFKIDDSVNLVIFCTIRKKREHRPTSIRFNGTIVNERKAAVPDDLWEYVIDYSSANAISHYSLQKYLLKSSFG